MIRVPQSHSKFKQSGLIRTCGASPHDDREILSAQLYIEEHSRHYISPAEVTERISMSRRGVMRRFKQATRNTPLKYLQHVKIEAAKKQVERSADNMGTVMYDVGHSNPKMVREVFRRYTGLTPRVAARDRSELTPGAAASYPA